MKVPLRMRVGLAYADDPGWPELVAELDGPDGPPSADLIDALIDVLRDWRPPKPAAIAAVPDPESPMRSAGIVHTLSARLGLPAIDALTWHGPTVTERLASGALVALVEDRLRRTDTSVPAAPVLLVAASARTRWTLTISAALLREAGATDVLPLVAHLKP